MENKLAPLFDKLIIETPAIETITAGGVVIPDVVGREKPMEGKVLAAGPEVKYVKPGDAVMFSKYAGVEIVQDGIPLLIMREEDVFAVKLV